MKLLRAIAITVVIIALSTVALADLYFEQRTTTSGMMGQPGQTFTQKVWLTRNQMCVENVGMGQKMIFDAAANKLIIINFNDRTYTETTPAQYKEMTSGMMAMMGGPGGMDFSVKTTGQTRKIGSWNCYQAIVSSQSMTIDMWVTKDIKFDKANYDKYTEIFASTFLTDDAIAEWKKLEGLPVLTTTNMTMGQMKMESKAELTRVSHDPISKDVFAVPAGFTKTEMKMPQMPH